VDDRPRYYRLEDPAFLGREFPVDPDPYRHLPRDGAAGSLVFLDLVLGIATLAYASKGAWFIALFCAIAAGLCGVAAWRKVKRVVEEEMKADPSETLRTLVRPRR
jgi:hypothetical protein